MKIRNGFVSNSSSSSFVIACKDTLKKELNALNVDKNSLWYNIVNPVIECLCDNITKTFTTEEDLKTFIEYEGYDDDYLEKYIQYLKNGYTIYSGRVYDDEDSIECLLCDTKLNYKSDTLIIEKDEGY